MSHEQVARRTAEMRSLTNRETEYRIAMGVLAGRVVDGRKRFKTRAELALESRYEW